MTVDLIAVVSSQTLLVADQRGEGEDIPHPENDCLRWKKFNGYKTVTKNIIWRKIPKSKHRN